MKLIEVGLEQPNQKLAKPGASPSRVLRASEFDAIEADGVERVVRFTTSEGGKVRRVSIPFERTTYWLEEQERHPPLSDKKKGKAE